MHVLVVYYSRSGNTETMAQEVAKGVSEQGVEVRVQKVADTSVDDLILADGIVLGSPTYYGGMAAPVKAFLDDSVKYHRQLNGKVGGAFTTSALPGGGNETTILSMLQALLIHGMVIQGTSNNDHYGPVAIGAPDERALRGCRELGARVAGLAKVLAAAK